MLGNKVNMNLKVSIGKSLMDGSDIFLDLGKEDIHTAAISGLTGSGKSTFHHSITRQIISDNTPNEIGFIFMDFKKVEFGEYKNSDYLLRPIIVDPKEAVTVLKDLVHESEQRFRGINDPQRAIIIHIEECDIMYYAPDALIEAWKAIEEQAKRNNMYMIFSSSRASEEVFSSELLGHANLKGWFVPGSDWVTFYDREVNAYASRILGYSPKALPEPWTRIFQPKGGTEIVCKGFIDNLSFILPH
jgi:hypothetical protein